MLLKCYSSVDPGQLHSKRSSMQPRNGGWWAAEVHSEMHWQTHHHRWSSELLLQRMEMWIRQDGPVY